MMRDIRRINKELGITVLYVTNRRGETEIAGQKVISMRDGEIVDIKKSESHKLIVQKRNAEIFPDPCVSFLFSAFQILVNIPLGHSPVLCDSFHC